MWAIGGSYFIFSFDGKFNWTISYRSDSDFYTPYDGECHYEEITKTNNAIMKEWMNKKTKGYPSAIAFFRSYFSTLSVTLFGRTPISL